MTSAAADTPAVRTLNALYFIQGVTGLSLAATTTRAQCVFSSKNNSATLAERSRRRCPALSPLSDVADIRESIMPIGHRKGKGLGTDSCVAHRLFSCVAFFASLLFEASALNTL